ncbi:MAG: hypothetical protein K5866_09670 [Treponema sp.]|nr:hypothetical protein [Treponema sp.]
MKKNIFKTIKSAFILLLFTSPFIFASCADSTGLHNQHSAQVTFIFQNFTSAEDGSYSIPGNFNDWDNTESTITMKNGSGSSSSFTITESNIQFTLVPVNSWTRSWYPSVKGNGNDGTQNKYHNFYIDGLDLDQKEITITINGNADSSIPEASY